MRSLSQSTKSYFFLKVLNVECAAIVLILIPPIPRNEGIIGALIDLLTVRVVKKIFSQIVYKNVFGDILYRINVSTHIFRKLWVINLCGSMSDHFFSPCSIFSPDRSVMIAFNPKLKESFSFHHFFVNIGVIVEFL